MAKILRKLKNQGKKRRFRKKIRFIRCKRNKAKSLSSEKLTNSTSSLNTSKFDLNSFSENSETEYCLNLSLINWSKNFLQDNPIPLKNEEFYKVLKKLCLKENEFVMWILYIEYYISQKKDIDIETLFYIGLFVKTSLDLNSNENLDQKIKKEKMDEIKNFLEGKIINSIEFNEKYNYFCKYTQSSKHFYYNINSMIVSIYKENLLDKKNKIVKKKEKQEENKKGKQEEKKKEKQEENKKVKQEEKKKEKQEEKENIVEENKNDIQENNITYNIDNRSFIPDSIYDEDNDMEQEINRDENWPAEGFENEEHADLPVDDGFIKLDSSAENLNLDNNLKGIFYFLKN